MGGKMVFSAGPKQLAMVAYVPEAKQGELSCEEWLQKVVSLHPGGKIVTPGKDYCVGVIPADADKNILPPEDPGRPHSGGEQLLAEQGPLPRQRQRRRRRDGLRGRRLPIVISPLSPSMPQHGAT